MHYTNAALLGLASVAAASHQKRAWNTPGNSAASSTGGKTHMISVGVDGLTFSPDTLEANVGDKVMFMFWPEEHSVVQGSFDEPCWPSSDQAFFSGYVPVKSGKSDTTFTIDIKNTDPIWIYCSQTAHCQGGMVGVINPEKGGSTLQQYAAGAAKSKSSKTPSDKWQGGVLSTGGSGTSGNDTTPPSSTPDAAGHVVASGSVVGAIAGFMAWALL